MARLEWRKQIARFLKRIIVVIQLWFLIYRLFKNIKSTIELLGSRLNDWISELL